MKIALFSNKKYWSEYFDKTKSSHEIKYLDVPLNEQTAEIAKGFDAVCAFVNDCLERTVLSVLGNNGVKCVLLRCAGFNNVDLKAAKEFGITVLRVPAYSPHSVAEFAVMLLLELNRKLIKSYLRVREGNFSLDGLVGGEMHGKTVGVIGTGNIGRIVSKILLGYGCNVIAYDVFESDEAKKMGVKYVTLDEIWKQADMISLHTPLLKDTYHMINDETIGKMKEKIVIVNTSRGGLVDTKAVIRGLKSGKIGALGLDVYEEETGLFFNDTSDLILQDDVLARLMTFNNVIITGHEAWFTDTSLKQICQITLGNMTDFEKGTIKKENLVEYQPQPNK
ncbi:D-lactate dehydrogenase [Heterostelium album PN500]|uniref:D-lactate dehydrogenase n=1 Tax=Heterostelium pallidum (strain ATCC 26659 / Pp 5 / PN500) TaxID=670386 RepID=D3BI20_HETP5|nr:D-lactate dehydrogenase [Heterostelium album PN500]EFA78920.1 D-lactate dehydrogenase [Heterostelium album PN500]|eukprot:XP_020431044.1 D-lactate dehydrogenase [Heterostelium album PN500]